MKLQYRHISYGVCLLITLLFPIRTFAAQSWKAPVTINDIRLSLYADNPKLPLDPELVKMNEPSPQLAALRTRYHLVYNSMHDEKVTAIFATPNKFAPPYPAVVLLAGSGGNKDSSYVRIAADMMATLGYATISIDAQYHGERARKGMSGDFEYVYNPSMRDAWIQTVIDLRRAVDFLYSRPDIDKKRIGFLGFSQGSMVGGTFLGVEHRITAGCLMVGGGGFVRWAEHLGILHKGIRRAMVVNSEITDPIYFIGNFAPHPLLMLAGKRDELIPRFATYALYNAAKEPKQLVWFNSGHILSPDALVFNARRFFLKYLGVRKELKNHNQ